MTTIRQSYEAARYHKKITLIFFLLFSFSLLALTFVSQLLSTQTTTIENLSLKINNIRKVFPQMNQNIGEQLIENNQNLTNIYHIIYFTVVLLAIFMFFLFGLIAAKIRKEEIQSLYYIGVKKSKIVKHLLSELMIPVGIACSLMTLFFLVGQQQLTNESFTVNRYILNNYFDETLDIPDSKDVKKQQMTKTSHSLSNSDSSDKTLTPYNKASVFDVEVKSGPATGVFISFVRNMVLLVIIATMGCLGGFYSYTTYRFSRRRSFV